MSLALHNTVFNLQVHENDVLDNLFEDEVKNAKWLLKKVDGMRYPPKIIVDIYCLKEQTKVEDHDFTLQVTGIRRYHDRNMSLEIFARSEMYREQKCEYYNVLFINCPTVTLGSVSCSPR